ncbi:MAG: Asp-tRNA(Asn)/Glu-tRNA(Gln) amidotransferase subunit GatB [Nitrospinae bacterium]|nr:Asp-tRNA(Asn)/Glu-tRNA(Gln) amidotransferase subunit GatB [Nitrospinota bacterium]
MDYEAVIGLEVHAQLLTSSKIFCSCSTQFGARPNQNTCPICLGMPGVLPVLNRDVVEFTIRTGLATNCRIALFSRFARKNYFYPDLPKGYQISQYELPPAMDGYIEIDSNGKKKRIGITRIHMEEDAGKLIHGENLGDPDSSYVDFNRTGVPLIEIVSEPEIRTPEEAREYLLRLKAILEYIEVCDCNMEEGNLRCDANISVRPMGRKEFGVKTEVKNMNSFKNVQRALEYEIKRQVEILERGGDIIQETRLWDVDSEMTISMRTKEEAHDYRYFPEPDLVPIVISEDWIEDVRKRLPELPDAKKGRFVREYGIPVYDAVVLTTSRSLAEYYESCVRLFPRPKIISNWVMGEILREFKNDKREINESPITPEHLTRMLRMIEEGTISGKIAKTVFEEMYRSGKMPDEVVKEKGLVQISDEGELLKFIDQVIEENPEIVEEYQKGKGKLFGYLVGEIMKRSKGKGNPVLINRLLKDRLDREDRLDRDLTQG